ncbi:hypothetical protein Fcan01_27355 [Folsomia candida]|uniref:Uncharacterized protein n=1 Tax=Folsomia candida TaxID=158441 RepID=A0A226CZG2_FOLCA|nr:hypothetical protein Fcan01_27355 [Folsomia candida]
MLVTLRKLINNVARILADSPSTCTDMTVAIKHNYTSRGNTALINLPIDRYVLSIGLIQIFTKVQGRTRYSILSSGARSEVFKLATVVSTQQSFNFESLLLPIDSETWICTGVALVVISFTVIALTKGSKHIVSNFTEKLFWSMAALIGQLDDGSDVFGSTKTAKKYAFLLVSWQLVSFILGMIYSGGLYSILAAVIPLTYPTTFTGLIPHNIQIYSTATIGQHSLVESSVKVGIEDLCRLEEVRGRP